jgi:hypothetical protein
MKNSIFLIVGLLLVSSQLLGQVKSKPIKHYFIEGNQSKEETLSEVNEFILLKSDSDPGEAAFLPPPLTSVILDGLMKYLPKLFYNPNKYIKEYGVSHPLFQDEHQKFIESFTYEKTGVNSKKETVSISQLKFEVKDISYLNNYKVITLSNFKINRSPVKLSSKNKFVNLVAEITLYYYDVNHAKKELKLLPLKVKNIVPGSSITASSTINSSQIIPPINNIEKIELKLTEVNSRKKDWDKWLELYDTNKDKLTELLSGLVTD